MQIMGELLSDRSSFKTHISLRMAPITDPQKLNFDLEGRVLEIDPRLIAKTSDKLGIQMAPFGIDPRIVCRAGHLEVLRSLFVFRMWFFLFAVIRQK